MWSDAARAAAAKARRHARVDPVALGRVQAAINAGAHFASKRQILASTLKWQKKALNAGRLDASMFKRNVRLAQISTLARNQDYKTKSNRPGKRNEWVVTSPSGRRTRINMFTAENATNPYFMKRGY